MQLSYIKTRVFMIKKTCVFDQKDVCFILKRRVFFFIHSCVPILRYMKRPIGIRIPDRSLW